MAHIIVKHICNIYIYIYVYILFYLPSTDKHSSKVLIYASIWPFVMSKIWVCHVACLNAGEEMDGLFPFSRTFIMASAVFT